MNNLTYFFGAGASAGTIEKPAIPILNVFNKKLQDFFNDLILKELNEKDPHREYTKIGGDEFLHDIRNVIPIFKNTINSNGVGTLFSNDFTYFISHAYEVLEDLNQHNTVDTLARKYYLLGSDGSEKLVNLKALLSIYFLHLHHNENKLDMRYDSFVSTLLYRGTHGNLDLPSNIKIISWNYDLQFEMALKKYRRSKLQDIQTQFGFHPSMEYYGSYRTMNLFGMVKLNGTAGLFMDLRTNSVRDIDEIASGQIERNELFNLFFGICRGGDLSVTPFYRYSWENDNERHDKLPNMKAFLTDYAKEIMSITNHLVVIGYSFPPFNRRVDIELFNCLPVNAIVYIQDTNPVRKQSVQDIFRNFEQKNITVQFIEDVSQFHIPPIYFEE